MSITFDNTWKFIFTLTKFAGYHRIENYKFAAPEGIAN